MIWNPVHGPVFSRFVDEQLPVAQEALRISTARIMSRCIKPAGIDSTAVQLVVGEVQSGKTMSFTGLAAMARDNGFAAVVILAGRTDNLRNQTVERLSDDLHMSGDGGANPWQLLPKLRGGDESQSTMTSALTGFLRPDLPPAFKRTPVVVSLKTRPSIEKVAQLFENVGKAVNMERCPVLVIDDEADQVSLDVGNPQDSSAVYLAIGGLRRSLPRHSYVMYTATPQAPLLIDLQDHLSPDTVTLLEAGTEYVGSAELFGGSLQFGQEVPVAELGTATDPGPDDVPPDSLRMALAVFLLELAHAQERGTPKPLSMLIHPSSARDVHGKYRAWVEGMLDVWRLELRDPLSPEFAECMTRDFERAFKFVKWRLGDISVLWGASDALRRMATYVGHWLASGLVNVCVVNSAREAKSISSGDWNQFAGWILIGGQKLDRGFTVENLAVTYMPRALGVGNADTIQQRGRFFGYKRSYQDLLCAWLSPDALHGFTAYVEHERSMREQLARVDQAGAPLKEWKRQFLLDPALKATRRQVIKLAIQHFVFQDGLIFSQRSLFASQLQAVQRTTAEFAEPLLERGVPHVRDTRQNPASRHLAADLDIADAVDLVANWPVAHGDIETISPVSFALAAVRDHDVSETVQVVLMDSLDVRQRSPQSESANSVATDLLEVNNLFVGRDGAAYAGDSSVRDSNRITIQVHFIQPLLKGAPYGSPVRALAVFWPARLSAGVVSQLLN